MVRNYNMRGFTLIELSIVLVIIGLIVGSVLVGQDLVRAATRRAIIADVESFKTAVATFRGKYDCEPGDCTNATTFFGQKATNNCLNQGADADTGTCNGNGNGKLDATVGVNTLYEPYLFWQQLQLAKLINVSCPGGLSGVCTGESDNAWGNRSLPGQNVPYVRQLSNNATYEAQYIDNCAGWVCFNGINKNAFVIGTHSYSNDLQWQAAISPDDAHGIDLKIDDGLPAKGNVQGLISTSAYATGCTTTDVASTSLYSTGNTVKCTLIILGGF